MDDNENIFEEIKELFKRLSEALKKWRQGRKDGKPSPAVFEKELKAVERKLEQFEEQDDIHTDALRDVAQTLERITGSIENGRLRNATAEEVSKNLIEISGLISAITKRGSEPYTVTSQTLDNILQKTFGKKQEDFYITTEGGQRVLSPNVKFAFDKHDGKKADVYMILDGSDGNSTGFKINVGKKDDLEKITFEKSSISCSDGKYELTGSDSELELMPLDSMPSVPLEKIIGEALFQSSEEYMKARIDKGYKMADEWKSISGTKDEPFTMDEFQCIHDDEGRYCIKDRLNDTMIAFSYNKEEKSFSATFYSDVKEGFDVSDKKGETVLKAQTVSQKNGKSSLSYAIATSPNADKILDTEMAQKALHMFVPDEESVARINKARHGEDRYQEQSGGELVQNANRDKIILLRNAIEERLRSQKGLDDYYVSYRSTRHGKETQIVITAPSKANGVSEAKGKSEYVINFDKNGNIRSHLWGSYDLAKGKRDKLKPIVSTSKNFINKVLDREGFTREDLCLCYQVVKESLQDVDAKLVEMGMEGFSQNLETLETTEAAGKAIRDGSLVQEWAQLAEDAIRENNLKGKIDDERTLTNLILEQAEKRDGSYPDAEYKEALSKNIKHVYYTLAEKGVIENTFSKEISTEHQEKEETAAQKFEAVGHSNAESSQEQAQHTEQVPSNSDIPDSVYNEMIAEFHSSDKYKADMEGNYGANASPEKQAVKNTGKAKPKRNTAEKDV